MLVTKTNDPKPDSNPPTAASSYCSVLSMPLCVKRSLHRQEQINLQLCKVMLRLHSFPRVHTLWLKRLSSKKPKSTKQRSPIPEQDAWSLNAGCILAGPSMLETSVRPSHCQGLPLPNQTRPEAWKSPQSPSPCRRPRSASPRLEVS